MINNNIGRNGKQLLIALATFVICLSFAAPARGQANTISAEFFGMGVNNTPAAPWPSTLGFLFDSWRTLGIEIKWSDIETCDGGSDPTNHCYTWTSFDSATAQAAATGQDILYSIDSTPNWASSAPTDTSCQRNSFPAGSCDAPNDIDAIPGSGLGDGTNLHFQNFINAMMTHVGPGKIKYWEVWDEPNVSHSWKGTNNQLVRLAKDTYNIVKGLDANALITTPPYVGDGIRLQFPKYLAAGGAQYADVVSYHGYVQTGTCPNDCPIPENEGPMVALLNGILQTYGLVGKPTFNTEGSWGNYFGAESISDPDQQVAFTGRYYLMHVSSDVTKLYWYSWNNPENGHFYDTTNLVVTPAGTAYEQLYNWLVGATLTAPCSNFNSQWFCFFTRPGTYVAQAVWDVDPTLICSGGVCPTVNLAVPTNYTQYLDLKGDTTTITNSTVPVGSKPVLIVGTTPNISVTQTVSPGIASPGATVTYSIVVKNTTTSAISSVTLVDDLTSLLTLTSCSSTPKGVCTTNGNNATVTFSSMAAAETDTITIVAKLSTTASGTVLNTATANWTLSGKASDNWATVGVVAGTPSATVKPGILSFGNQTVSTTSLAKNVVITNTGTGNLILNNIGTSGANNTDFGFTSSDLPITVVPQGTTTIGVTFTPLGVGTRSATLYIYNNTTTNTFTVTLGGNGVAKTTTGLTSSVNPASVGQSVTFTATVSCSASVAPTGMVSFKKGSTVLGTGTLGTGNTATYTTSTLPVGWQTITAAYAGDNNCGTSNGSLSQGVKVPTAVAVQSSVNPSVSGQAVTFTATVTSSSGTPSGNVSFKSGGITLKNVALNSSGVATFTTSTLAVGSHSLSVAYQGTSIYFPSTSPVLTQVVNQ